MSYFRRKLERRTFSQDRYYILIKRQKAGKATFSELTELDEIVNRVPDIREKVLRENFEEFGDESGELPGNPLNNPVRTQTKIHTSFWAKLRGSLKRLFTSRFDTNGEEFKNTILSV